MNTYRLYTIGKIFGTESGMFVSVYEEYKSALLHVDKFSHIIIFYIDQPENKPVKMNNILEHNNRAVKNIQQYSLTQIKLAVAKLLAIDNTQGVIRIDSTGSISGILVDIKPYFPIEDRIKECIVPEDLTSFPSFVQYNSIKNTNRQSIPNNLSSLKGVNKIMCNYYYATLHNNYT